jgi:Fe-S oxidoreductase
VGTGRSSGYLAYTLGLHETARILARATVEEMRRIGCRTLVVLSPEQAYLFRTLYPLLGVPLPEDVEVVELTILLTRLLDEGRLKLRPAPIDLVYHDPCQTPRIDGRWRAPRRLLATVTTLPLREGFWREKRAANCGASGGLPWTQPSLAAAMARAALADAAASGASLFVTDAPNCLIHLRANADGQAMMVRGLYELLADRLDD